MLKTDAPTFDRNSYMLKSIGFVSVFVLSSLAWAGQLPFGPFAGLDADRFAGKEQRRTLVEANEDCIDVESYRLPRHARPMAIESRDGGSRMYFGAGYVLVVRHSLCVLGGEKAPGYIYGYEIYPGTMADIERDHPAPFVAHTWFVDNTRMSKIDAANAKMLEERIPKDWIHDESDASSLKPKAIVPKDALKSPKE